jgi:acyl-coenzyme A thioesterase PaaI-like protein
MSDEGLTELVGMQMLERSFVSGAHNEERLRVRYFSRDADSAVIARVHFGPRAEGPPRHAHGGSIAAVFDEAMGLAGWISGHKVVAARLSVEFKRSVPLGTEATLTAWVERVDGKRVVTRATLVGKASETFGEAEGLFVIMGDDHFAQLAGQ